MKPIYLDNAATTKVDDLVVEAMLPYFTESFGNASSVHSFGQSAEHGLDQARQGVAEFLGCQTNELIFTSGATESNNLAIQGVLKILEGQENLEFVTTSIEHPSVLSVFKEIEKQGHTVHFVSVNEHGIIDLNELESVINENTVLVSTMYVNNEVGSVQPLSKIKELIEKAKESRSDSSKPLYWHVDAVQAGLYFDCDVKNIGCDLLTLSSHKLHGPKGGGVLYNSEEVKLKSLVLGGHQEFELRPGTENVPGIVGFAKALSLVEDNKAADLVQVKKIQQELIAGLNKIENIKIFGNEDERSPAILNIGIAEVSAERLVMALDIEGVAVSTGSACASGSMEPSHVLIAMGVDKEILESSIRVSISKYTTLEEIEMFLKALKDIVSRFRTK